jgi:hypothetical protein
VDDPDPQGSGIFAGSGFSVLILIWGRERELISFKHQENITQIDANRHKNKLSQ